MVNLSGGVFQTSEGKVSPQTEKVSPPVEIVCAQQQSLYLLKVLLGCSEGAFQHVDLTVFQRLDGRVSPLIKEKVSPRRCLSLSPRRCLSLSPRRCLSLSPRRLVLLLPLLKICVGTVCPCLSIVTLCAVITKTHKVIEN